MAMRGKPCHIPAGPGEIGWFVDRSEVADSIRPGAKMLRRGAAVVCKTFREFSRENINVFRVAVMEQVPDHIDAIFAARLHERID